MEITTTQTWRQYSLKSNMESAADKEERKREYNRLAQREFRRRRKEHLRNLEQAQKEQNSEQSEEIERLRYQNDELRNEALGAQIYGPSWMGSRAAPIKGAHSALSDLTSLSLLQMDLRNSPPAAFAARIHFQPMPSFEDLTNTPTSTRSSSSSIVHTTKASRGNSKFKMSDFFCNTCNQVFTRNHHLERHYRSKRHSARKRDTRHCKNNINPAQALAGTSDQNLNAPQSRDDGLEESLDGAQPPPSTVPTLKYLPSSGLPNDDSLTPQTPSKHVGGYTDILVATGKSRSLGKENISSLASPFWQNTPPLGPQRETLEEQDSHIDVFEQMQSTTSLSHLTRNGFGSSKKHDVPPCSSCGDYDKNTLHTGLGPKFTGNWYCIGCRPEEGVNRSHWGIGGDSQVRSHSTAVRPFQCSWQNCDKKYTQRRNLRFHIRTHTKEKPHVCNHDGCGRQFSDPSCLGRHRKTHTGRRPFKCDKAGCAKSFARNDTKLDHQRRVHETPRLENGRFLSMPQHSGRTHEQQASLIQTGLQLHHVNGPIQLQAPDLSNNGSHYIPEEHNPEVATLILPYHAPYSSIGFNTNFPECEVPYVSEGYAHATLSPQNRLTTQAPGLSSAMSGIVYEGHLPAVLIFEDREGGANMAMNSIVCEHLHSSIDLTC